MIMTQAEREEWFSSPMTQLFLGELRTKRFDTMNTWAAHGYIDYDDAEKSARLNLYALAGIDILDQIIEMVEDSRPQQREVD